jgi:protein O-mannosyl-transferase
VPQRGENRQKYSPIDKAKHGMVEKHFSPGKIPWLLALVLFLFAFLLYRNTVHNGYTLDDAIYYTDNKFVQEGIKGIPSIFGKSTYFGFNGENDKIYRPLPVACFAVEYSLFGNNPHLNHFVNVVLFALSCCLLFFAMKRLFAVFPLWIPFCIGLLFAAHPIHTEVVASIKGLDEILAFLFSIIALLGLINYCDSKKAAWYALGLAAFPFCLLAKEHTLTLVGIVPITLYVFRSFSLKRIAVLTLPFLFIALLFIVVRNHILDSFTFSQPLSLINNTLLATNSSADRLATAFVILGKYLRLLFVPYPLCWDYSYNQIPITSWMHFKPIVSLCIYTGLLLYGAIGIWKKSPLAYGILFFLMTFSISTNLFIKIGTTLGERLLFTPSLGFCIAAIFLIYKSGPRYRKWLLPVMMAGVIPPFALLTVNRNGDWKSNFSLVSHDIAVNSASAGAHNGLGNEYYGLAIREKDSTRKSAYLSRATDEYLQSIAIYPSFKNSWIQLSTIYWQGNQKEKALEAYRKILALEPGLAATLNNMGSTFFSMGNYDSASCYFQKAIRADKKLVEAYLNMGALNTVRKNWQAALDSYENALKVDPRNGIAYLNMSNLYKILKDTVQAEKSLAAAQRFATPTASDGNGSAPSPGRP